MVLNLRQAIMAKKSALAAQVKEPLAELAERCAEVWPDADALDGLLRRSSCCIPFCHLCYAWGVDNIQVSSLVMSGEVYPGCRGRDLSDRPYLQKSLPFKGVMLSSVYYSNHTRHQCITALHAVNRDNALLGFIAGDFDLRDLPSDSDIVGQVPAWRQYKGDAAVRGTLFMQKRMPCVADDHIDEIIDVVERLMCEHGVFHSKIHFSSGRCTLWLYDDPFRYQMLSVDEILDMDTCLAYPMRPYPKEAVTDPRQIALVLAQYRALRLSDDTLYLRVGSINIINGMVGLTFSCDGSHYMPVEEFLERDLEFWFGPQPGTLARREA